eukprot:TRINITY_DN17675_c0_g1_i2.p1 TRINITY_DN17675_c0_g1~~TRINITY_DN17675_c0_g1_i2.p1  ORF type:complete len:568 (-),score=127.98 TRINITY_DN17675_c0_g1_i2:234-1937(-)
MWNIQTLRCCISWEVEASEWSIECNISVRCLLLVATNEFLVMKQIAISQMDRSQRSEALSEARILQSLSSPYIVSYHSSFIENEKLCIVMEYCENGDLSRLLAGQHGQFLEEDAIWKYFIEICLALLYLHNRKILHRDIKTMNVFLTKDFHVRLGDLGVAKVLSQNANFAHTMVGTPYYLSPELCQEKPYNEKSDVWSLGCLLYELCALKHPFEARNQAALIMRIVQGRYDPLPNIYSKELLNIVTQCLQKDYRKRYSVHDILTLTCVQLKAKSLGIEIPDKSTLSLKVVIRVEPKKTQRCAVSKSIVENPLRGQEENKSKFAEQEVKVQVESRRNLKPPAIPKQDAKQAPISVPLIIEPKTEEQPQAEENKVKAAFGIKKPAMPAGNSRLTPQPNKKPKAAPKSRVNNSIYTKSAHKKAISKIDFDAINSVANLPDFAGTAKKQETKPYSFKKPNIEELIKKSAVENANVKNNESHDTMEEIELESNEDIEASASPLERTIKLLKKKQEEHKERLERFNKKKKELASKVPLSSIEKCCKLACETREMVMLKYERNRQKRRRIFCRR